MLEAAGSNYFSFDFGLITPSERDLQHALDRFSGAYDQVGMNISI